MEEFCVYKKELSNRAGEDSYITSNNLLIAVTGGIGSGKSTLSTLFERAGALVLSADELARKVVSAGAPALVELTQKVGSHILDENGELNRKALADAIFSSPATRLMVEQIIHPQVGIEARAGFGTAEPGQICVYDIPLINTSAQAGEFDAVIVVEASEATKLDRLEKRGVPRKEAQRRISAQVDDIERRNWANVIVKNEGTKEDLQKLFAAQVWPLALSWKSQVERRLRGSGNVEA